MNQLTIFQDFWHTKEPYFVSFETVMKRITSSKNEDKVRQIQNETDEKEADRLKKSLVCICFSGRFSIRKDENQTHHSGLAVLDWDSHPGKFYAVADAEGWQAKHPGTLLTESPDKPGRYALTIPDPAKFRDSLQQYPFLASAFISPSGKGVKAVARIPANIATHRGYYAGLVKFFEILDTTSQNESRICFDSYDPDAWVNEEFVEFTDYHAPVTGATAMQSPNPGYAPRLDYSKLNRCADMIRHAGDGEKHEVLLKAARLAGGYVASGVLDEDTAVRILQNEIRDKPNVDDVNGAYKTIADGIEYGKRAPIYEQQPEEQPVPRDEANRSGIKYLAGVWEEMDNGFINGKKRGETTHYADLDECWTWKRGEFTLISGRPGSGKSEWILQMMLIKSVTSGWKWAVFSPESFPASEFYDTLIHSYIGKTTDPFYGASQMTPEEYERGANFIQEHFFYVYPDVSHTIEEIEADFLYLHKTHGLAGVLIDPFNQITRDFNLRDDQYLDRFIMNRQRMAREYQLHYLTVAHPKQIPKNSKGEYDPVDAYDIANGAMWINKTDNFISIYRPHQGTNPKDTSVEIQVKKVKRQKLVGIPGDVYWHFKRNTNRYYDGANWTPLDPNSGPSSQFPVSIPSSEVYF